jgi:hypothetical protein
VGGPERNHLNQIFSCVHIALQEVDHGIPRPHHQDPAKLAVRHASISKRSGGRLREIQCKPAVTGMLRISLQSG